MTINSKNVKQSLQSITTKQIKMVSGGIEHHNAAGAIPSIFDFNHPLHPNNQLSYSFPHSSNWTV